MKTPLRLAQPKLKTLQRPAIPSPSVEPMALNAPITVLQGIGPRNAQNLARVGLHTLRDMLYYFPRRYDDYSKMKPINRLWFGEEVTVIGNVQSIATRPLRGGSGSLVEAVVSDGSGALRVTWFNQPWLTRRLHKGAYITLSGKVDQYLGRLVMTNPDWEDVEQQHLNTGRIVPVYPLTAQVTQGWLRKQMNQLVSFWAPRVQDTLPEAVRRSAELPDLSAALMQVHFPNSWDDLKAAQHRLAFDEIFLLQLGVLSQKRQWQSRTAQKYDSRTTLAGRPAAAPALPAYPGPIARLAGCAPRPGLRSPDGPADPGRCRLRQDGHRRAGDRHRHQHRARRPA